MAKILWNQGSYIRMISQRDSKGLLKNIKITHHWAQKMMKNFKK
jgi:hypothetical protein